MARAVRHGRVVVLGALVLILGVVALLMTTAGGGTVAVADASSARTVARDLRSGLRQIRCECVSMAWSCTGARRGRAWTCRVYLAHTTKQALTGSCRRVRRVG